MNLSLLFFLVFTVLPVAARLALSEKQNKTKPGPSWQPCGDGGSLTYWLCLVSPFSCGASTREPR